jgi:predicted AlkP superfamily phosphohydrolase/phosphomutase
MRPLVLIGLDGATFDVLDPLVTAGDLPTLAGLVQNGARGVLRSTNPPITPAAWSSFMTGKRPGKHGIYDFRVYEPHAYRDSFVTSRSLRDATLWALFTAAGHRVAVVGLPMMYPPQPQYGTVVSGFDTPSAAAMFTSPPELRTRILERFPDYVFAAVPAPTDPNLETDEAFESFVAQVERAFEQRTWIALELLRESRWDVLMVHHQDTDTLQHLTWRYISPGGDVPERRERVRNAYRRLDTLLGELLAAVPEEALRVVLSDHGFGSHTGRVFPNTLLQKWGYLSWRGRRRARLQRSLRKRLERLGITRARPRLREESWDTRMRTQSFEGALPLRWTRTRAYMALGEIHGLLYVNRKGREPGGIVAEGAATKQLVEELRDRLLAVRDPRDGASVFADVVRADEIDPDDTHGRRPDLILVPRPGYTLRRELHQSLWIDYDRLMSGTHRSAGLLVVSGAGVRPGPLSSDPELIDLAPTLLAVAGLPIPQDMDGRVLGELFVEPPAIDFAPAGHLAGGSDENLSADEEALVEERLRALGYLA